MSSHLEASKRAAARRAVDAHLLPTHRYVGIGSGSTVVHVVDAIAARGPAFWSRMLFIPTGSQSKALIRAAGLPLCHLADRPYAAADNNTTTTSTSPVESAAVDSQAAQAGPNTPPGDGGASDVPPRALVALDVAFDGADEVDPLLNCIKGGGACLLQEKAVAVCARTFVVVADHRKRSPALGTQWTQGIPIEVVPFCAGDVRATLLREGGAREARVRSGLPAKAGEMVTDNGNWIIDAVFAPLVPSSSAQANTQTQPPSPTTPHKRWTVDGLATWLKSLEGVVETGLFFGVDGVEAARLGRARPQKPVAAYFGMPDGSVEELHTVAQE